MASSSPSVPWQVRGAHHGGNAGGGGTWSPSTFALGGLSPMGVQHHAPSHQAVPMLAAHCPHVLAGGVSGVSGVVDVGGMHALRLHAGH